MPVLMLRYPALLPEATAFIAVAGAADAALARAARASEEPFTFAVFVRDHDTRPMRIGCAAVVEQVVVEGGQLLGVRARGLARVELIGALEADGSLVRAQVRVLDAHAPADALMRAQLARVQVRLRGAGPAIDAAAHTALLAADDPGRFADLLAAQLDDLSLDERLQLLVTREPANRLVVVERLLEAREPTPTRAFGRVWAALRVACNVVPAQASLAARARGIDTGGLEDPGLRRVVEDMARAEPILVVEPGDTLEREARREYLSQLKSAIRSLTALRGCGDADDADDAATQAAIAATIAFLFEVAGSEHAAMGRTQ